jgi:hypothetical protein
VLADPRFSRAVTVGREDTPRATPQPAQPASLLSMSTTTARLTQPVAAHAEGGDGRVAAAWADQPKRRTWPRVGMFHL